MEVKYDQHFLIDNQVLDIIIENANISDDDIILEIGPGKGVLTKKLLKKNPQKLIAVELDGSFEEELRILEDESFAFHLEIGNGLEKLDKFVYNKLIANIPYSITEPLYRGLIREKINFAILLHGIDFYKNIIQRDTKWKYFITSFFEVELLQEVPGNSFNPPTKVNSALVKLEYKQDLSKKDEFFQNLYNKETRNVKNSFVFAVVDTLGVPKSDIKEFISSLELSEEILETLLSQLNNETFCFIVEKILEKYF